MKSKSAAVKSGTLGLLLFIVTMSSAQTDPLSIFDRTVYGGGIPLRATSGVPPEKSEHARKVMEALLLKDRQNSGAITAALKKDQAMMVIIKDFDERQEKTAILTGHQVKFADYDVTTGEALGENESRSHTGLHWQDLEGHEIFPDYLKNGAPKGKPRDATYEEITHLIHGHGIKSAYPDFQEKLEWLMPDAVKKGLYNPHRDVSVAGAVAEYLALGVEVYYGNWQSYTYVGRPKTREGGPEPELRFSLKNDVPLVAENLKKTDPSLYQLIESVFPTQKELRKALGWD